jgi:(1->4)-alpha-D-glucan 1-alpha-D-glucosylmutase
LDVLTEIPRYWTALVRRWHRLNRGHRTLVDGRRTPDNVTAYLFYQSIVGIWPPPAQADAASFPDIETIRSLRERLEEYMCKAAREAKTQTSWTHPDQAYEDALLCFVRSCLWYDGSEIPTFLGDIQHLVARIARPGFWNSLARTVIQYTSPGTPDLYQGDELWEFSLVDPDNRRPVDFQLRQSLLNDVIVLFESEDKVRQEFLRELVESPEDGRIKLHTIRTALSARRSFPQLFSDAHYVPLQIEGAAGNHVLAYARVAGEQAAVVAVPRLTISRVASWGLPPLGESVWPDTVIKLPNTLRKSTWYSVLTGEQISGSDPGFLRVCDLLRSFPAAIWIG